MPVDGGHRRHRVANEPHRVIEQVPSLRRDLFDPVVVLTPTRHRAGAPDDPGAFVGDDRHHARQRLGPRHVYPTDPRVRMRAPQDPAVDHPRKCDVARVGGPTGHTLDGVDTRGGRPHSGQLGNTGPASVGGGIAYRAASHRFYGLDERVVVRAPAQVPGHPLLNLSPRRRPVAGKDRGRRHQLPRRAETTLRAIAVHKRPL